MSLNIAGPKLHQAKLQVYVLFSNLKLILKSLFIRPDFDKCLALTLTTD